MSRLKEVDDEWIVRRLERWGEKDGMPFIGPDKADIIQGIVRDAAPRVVVEVGGMCGYSGLKLAQALPEGAALMPACRPPRSQAHTSPARARRLRAGGRVLSIERDWKWVLAAKRFLWQAGGGPRNAALREAGLEPVGRRVTVLWGDARQVLSRMELPVAAAGGGGAPSIDLLLLDGTPKETLEYLRAAEPRLADGATVIADNAGARCPRCDHAGRASAECIATLNAARPLANPCEAGHRLTICTTLIAYKSSLQWPFSLEGSVPAQSATSVD